MWCESWRADPRGAKIADGHYNRQKVGAKQFVPPGRCVVLRTAAADALWVTAWPYAEYVKHAWPGAWINSTFRNTEESDHTASALIREAVAATRWYFGNAPEPHGLISFVDERKIRVIKVRGVPTPGFVYLKAGFRQLRHQDGTPMRTKEEGHLVFQMLGPEMPPPEMPIGAQARCA
jgi:hypothetical protein